MSAAAYILIDNSAASINGDFYPTRLDSEKLAADALQRKLFKKSSKSQAGAGGLSGNDFGVICSLTGKQEKVSKAINSIKVSGCAKFVEAIKCSLLALRHRNSELKMHRVIAFIGSKNNLSEASADELADMANKDGAAVDIVAFGNDVDNLAAMKHLVDRISAQSYLLKVAPKAALRDAVLSSPIGLGNETPLNSNAEDEDPEIAEALRQSMEGQGEDPEMEEAIRQSLMSQNENDPALENAIRASLEDDKAQFHGIEKKKGHESEKTAKPLK